MKFLYLLLFIGLGTGCNGIGKVLKSKDQDYKLRMAEKYYAAKKYNQAQQLYEDLIPFYRGRPEFEDIYYKYAYTAYNQKDYVNAENLFKTYIEVFPNTARAEEMDFMRAYTFYKQSPKAPLDQTNTIKAMGMMQTFINTHPGSARIKEANDIIDASREKLEVKDSRAAQLYFDLSQYRASAVAFGSLINNYPDSKRSDEYKLMSIKSYFKFAELSIEGRKVERFEKVMAECNEFVERFPESNHLTEVKQFLTQSQNNLKNISNESNKTPA